MTLFQQSSAKSQLRSCFTAFRDCARRQKVLKLKVSVAKTFNAVPPNATNAILCLVLHALQMVQCPTLPLGITSSCPVTQVATRLLKRYQYSAFQAWQGHTVWVRAVKAKGSYLHRIIITKTASQVCLSNLLFPHNIFRLSFKHIGLLPRVLVYITKPLKTRRKVFERGSEH